MKRPLSNVQPLQRSVVSYQSVQGRPVAGILIFENAQNINRIWQPVRKARALPCSPDR